MGKRILSRKGCTSCKRLRIKCDEAKPACEYCVATNRHCEYLTDSTPTEAHEQFTGTASGVNGSNLDSVSSQKLSLTGTAVYSYNSVATQMNMTRFEYRLLRFFNDACIPLFSFDVNKEVDNIWRCLLPKEFSSSDVVRQSVFAFACLNLWDYSNVDEVLDSDKIEWTSEESELSSNNWHAFENSAVVDSGPDNIYSKTASYFSKTVEQSSNSCLLSEQSFFFSGSLIFAFLGLHPHSIMPVVDFESDPPSDILSFAGSIKKLIDEQKYQFTSLGLLIGNLTSGIFGTPVFRSAIVGQLRLELHDYYFEDDGFAEINSKTSHENEIFEEFLTMMENCFSFAIYKGYPIPIFRMLYTVPLEYAILVRARHPFALRTIFVYCCICIFGGFYMSRNSNMWMDYVRFHLIHFGPLGALENSVYYYMENKRRVNFDNFAASMQEFDSMVAYMTQHEEIRV